MADGGLLSDGFTFEGRAVALRPGQSLAAALTEAGIRSFRETGLGTERGVFCGMGVCQDCLVEVDGVPNLRACMTKAAPGMAVRRQPARARLDAAPPVTPGPVRVETPDVLVIGGGAGGLTAASVAAEAGARVLVLDERPTDGGQYYKQPAGQPVLDPQQADGAALVARARASGAVILSGVEVWGAFDGPVFAASEGDGALIVRPRLTIVATGAYERPCLVPGWDLPGVMTTGAAQTLWRSYRTLPGMRVVVAGAGPLNQQVALELAQGGARIVALAEAAPSPATRPQAVARMAAADPGLTAKGLRIVGGLARRRVFVRYATVLDRIERRGEALAVTLRGPGGPFTVAADAVAMNDGFQPSNEILRLLGCAMDWHPRFGELKPVRDAEGQTSVPGLYAVGDCCGMGGAPAAVAEGAIAGAAAARALGLDAPEPAEARAALARARGFQDALWTLYARPRQDIATIPPETLVCRCEGISKGDLDAALAADPGGGTDIGAIKRATRLGMGRCQGRYCGPALVSLMAARSGRPPHDRAFFAPRAPIKPVRIATVLAAEAAVEALRAPE